MKICLVQEYYDDAACAALIACLSDSGVEWERGGRPSGDIPRLPCIAAVNDAGVAVHAWDAPASVEDLVGAYLESGAVETPARRGVPVSRVRFDALMAEAIGEVDYDNVLDAIAAVAATTPKTENSVKVKRALRALDTIAEIEFPYSPIESPDPADLTAQFLAIVIATLSGTVTDIADKIDAGLEAWREYTPAVV